MVDIERGADQGDEQGGREKPDAVPGIRRDQPCELRGAIADLVFRKRHGSSVLFARHAAEPARMKEGYPGAGALVDSDSWRDPRQAH